MNRKMIVLGAVVILLAVGLSGCIGDKGKFVGTWKNSIGIVIYTFNDDNTYQGTITSGTFKIEDGKLICIADSYIATYEYEFLNDDNTLILNGIGGAGSYTLSRS